MKNVFYLREIFSLELHYQKMPSKIDHFIKKLTQPLNTIEKKQPCLKVHWPEHLISSRLALDKTKLASLLDTVNEIDTTKTMGKDVIAECKMNTF